VVGEPGRRIVKEELASSGSALPWVDGIAFSRAPTVTIAPQPVTALITLRRPALGLQAI
jgi:predicted ATPase